VDVVLGTKNPGKATEILAILRNIEGLHLLTVAERPFADVPETGESFVENAWLKATAIARETGLPVFAEDAGLQVDALGGAPGVRSARFSGEPVDTRRNNARLIELLVGVSHRCARFVAVAALCIPGGPTFVSAGVLSGRIAERPRGDGGFGYDPLFVPDGGMRTLAELSIEEKNAISHRRRAAEGLRGILLEMTCAEDLAGRSRSG